MFRMLVGCFIVSAIFMGILYGIGAMLPDLPPDVTRCFNVELVTGTKYDITVTMPHDARVFVTNNWGTYEMRWGNGWDIGIIKQGVIHFEEIKCN